MTDALLTDHGPNPATQALLDFAADAQADGTGKRFDGADVSQSGIGSDAASHPAWDAARDGLRLAGRQLAGASLRQGNLPRVNLAGADLSGMDGSNVNLTSASVEGANLSGADLIGAVLTGANGGEADFSKALLEDAKFQSCSLRFANFTGAILDGADLSSADLWGARLDGVTAERANLESARLDESYMNAAELTGANLGGATLRRARLAKAVLRDANLRGATLDGADLSNADLSRATLPNVSLTTSSLTHVCFAGAWLDRTRMQASALGGMVGEEAKGNLEGAVDSYLVLEGNFRSLGMHDDESWCYLRRRRVQKQLYWKRSKELYREKEVVPAVAMGARYVGDVLAEWLCDYGDSLARVARAFFITMLAFAIFYKLTGSLHAREGFGVLHRYEWVNYLLFSLDSMTTVGTSEVALRPTGEMGILLSSLQTVIGTTLLGLFGFVLGGRIRS